MHVCIHSYIHTVATKKLVIICFAYGRIKGTNINTQAALCT